MEIERHKLKTDFIIIDLKDQIVGFRLNTGIYGFGVWEFVNENNKYCSAKMVLCGGDHRVDLNAEAITQAHYLIQLESKIREINKLINDVDHHLSINTLNRAQYIHETTWFKK